MVGTGTSDESGLGGTGAPPGLVLFAHAGDAAHGRGTNAFLADALSDRGFRTERVDLLSRSEAADPSRRHDVGLLAMRLETAVDDALRRRRAPLGVAASALAATATLQVAARRPTALDAIALRSPRLSLVRGNIPYVRTPTLVILGACDRDGRAEAQDALRTFACHVRVQTVSDADSSFEEAGALEAVVALMAEWFEANLGHVAEPPGGPRTAAGPVTARRRLGLRGKG